MVVYIVKFYLSQLLQIYRLAKFRYNWKRINNHNYTIPVNCFDLTNIKIGLNTYGPIHVLRWNMKNEGLNIGSFCSIASNVKFILGGNHNLYGLTTYPVSFKLLGGEKDTLSNGPIVIKDDVWIGTDVIILSGLTIGQGAVIAAGSIVTKDVEPYSIVGGNPAMLIKKRFDNDVIDKLLKVDVSKWSLDYIESHENVFCSWRINMKLIKELE